MTLHEAEPAPLPFRARLGARLMRLAGATVDLLLPPQCMACRRLVSDHASLCSACWGSMDFIERPYCERLGIPFAYDHGPGALSPGAIADPPAYGRARAVARFDGAAREMVHRLKFGDRLELARPMGRWMARAGAEVLAEAEALVPVPLHPWRLLRRRYNQAELLAGAVAAAGGPPVEPGLLRRVRATRPQVGLGSSERARNIAGAFRVPSAALGRVRGRRLVIVDDVLTTGATLDAAARVLRRAGAASVDVLIFALVFERA